MSAIEADGADRSAGRRLLGELIRPHRRSALGVLLLALVQTGAALAGPWLVGVAIDRSLPDAEHGDYTSLTAVGIALVASALLAGWLRSVFVIQAGHIGQAIIYTLRRRAFDHAQRLSVSFHDRFTSGRVISRLTSDVETLNELIEAGLDGLLTALFQVIAIAVVLLVLDPWLGLVSIAALVPIAGLYRWFAGRAAAAFTRTRESVATLIVEIVEMLNGIRAVQGFRRERRNDTSFAVRNDDYRAANRRTFVLQALFIPGTALIGNISVVVVLLIGGYRVAHGGLQLGVLAAFILYLGQFYGPLEDLGMFYNSLQSATAALEKIALLLGQRPSVAPPAEPVALADPVRGQLELASVRFGYDPARPVLHELTLTVPAGQTVALVGATGAGKTSIAKLISRFYDPDAGVIRLDGIALTQLSDTELHRAVVMVTQEGFLFSGTVADNIGFGRVDASRDEIEAAACAVGADEFIRRLPDGYDTDVRKRGGRLSAGQRQLVAFARAFLADPAVLILDEATSSLDVPSERAVQRALRTVLAERTALIIAHRLSTVEIADRVVVLADGCVIEDGSPAELIAEGGGQFAALHTSWAESLV